MHIKNHPKVGWLKDDITQEDDNHNDLEIAFATVLLKTNYSSDSTRKASFGDFYVLVLL